MNGTGLGALAVVLGFWLLVTTILVAYGLGAVTYWMLDRLGAV